MKEKIVSFEVAKLAKERGFKSGGYSEYTQYHSDFIYDDDESHPESHKAGEVRFNDRWYYRNDNTENENYTKYEAPSQSVLQRWLREKHKVYVESTVDQRGSFNHRLQTYFTCIINYRCSFEVECKRGMGRICMRTYPTYEEAIENALEEALERLDEITYKNSTKS